MDFSWLSEPQSLIALATLTAEGLGQHFPKGYIYFAMGFSVFVGMLNLKLRKSRSAPVELREPYVQHPENSAHPENPPQLPKDAKYSSYLFVQYIRKSPSFPRRPESRKPRVALDSRLRGNDG